jgi:hypothetical protein
MPVPDKDTIYIDIDDEITGIIDKVKNSKSKVVALVLPKRASVFQSIVNMKLLRRAADASNKNLVLITSEAGLLPLAGASQIHVAKTLTSKPEIPAGPRAFDDSEQEVDEDANLFDDEPNEPINGSETIGALAADQTSSVPNKINDDGLETVDLDNTTPDGDKADLAEAAAAGDLGKDAKKADKEAKEKAKQDKKLAVPNFKRFRKWAILAVILLLIIVVLFIVLSGTLNKATIDISTDATNVPVNLTLNLDTNASSIQTTSDTIPAKYDQEQKTFSQEVGTTGQKNEGNKASGNLTDVTASCNSGNIAQVPSDIPAGTGVSANNQTYITQDDITFQLSASKKGCTIQGTDATTNSNSIPIIAQNGGSSYNVSGVSFTIAGNPNVNATGTASGGTDNNVQVVNQNDINNAKNKITAGNSATIKEALQSQLTGEGYYAISDTFSAGTPTTTSSANVGDTANSVTVTESIDYSMYGVRQSELKSLVDNYVDSQINTNKQSILDEGLSNAKYSVANTLSSSGGAVTLTTNAEAGPEINIANIKSDAEGKVAGDIKSQLMNDPDVTSVSVKISPFWASKAPKNPSKITVNVAKPTKTQ